MWPPTEIGALLAEREFTLLLPGGQSEIVAARVGVPVPGPDEGDPWWCCVAMVGQAREDFLAVAGEDALQAMLLGLRYLRARLGQWASRGGGSVTWLGDPGDLGLPDDPPTRLVEQVSKMAGLLHDLRVALRSSQPHEELVEGLLVRADGLLVGWEFGPQGA